MPDHPDHPDHEQLAAHQAGDGDRRQRADVEAHLAGCPSCVEVVASVERARRRLALLGEPELPAGLHDRLAAAVDREAATALPHRPTPWHRRPVAWGAAAALILAALVVPFLSQPRGIQSTTAAGGGSAEEAAQAPGAADLPVFTVKGEVTAAAVRSTLTADARASQALARAAGGAAAADRVARNPATGEESLRGRPTAPSPTATTPGQGSPTGDTATPGQGSAGGDASTPPDPATGQRDGYRSGATPPPASPGSLDPRACLPAATTAADPATRPLVPAFYVEGTHQGRPATVLVTTSTPQPGRVDLWIFPRDDCSTPPLATARVR